ncbi:MFS transporter [Novosphingobium rosa]|uniref:MFS transporter n=1 Tax=Novosphingobium rosa TaxID=76978 RepID=UPI0038991478
MVAVLGNLVEWYDATLYGLLAVFLAKAFFSFSHPATALLATYATLITSYIVRPVAGLMLGRLADLRGHRFVLILTINLMSLGTVGIGLLPTYAAIGVWSPIMLVLCRTLQGIGASAEYTVATSYVLEQQPGARPNYLIGWSIAATNLGPLLASVVAMGLTTYFGDHFADSEAWRIPFLLSAPLGLLALYLRRQMVDDGQLHAPSAAERKAARVPLFTALRGHWGTAFRVIAMGAGHRVGTFCIQAYFVTALIQQGFGASLSMLASILLYLLGAPAALLGGILSDRFGGRRVLVSGFVIYAALTVPLFSVLGISVPLTLSALVICAIINNIVAAPLSNAYIMAFPRAVRGAAAALNFNLGTALIGATAPLVATWLEARTGSEIAFGWYMTVLCAVSAVTSAFAYPKRLLEPSED